MLRTPGLLGSSEERILKRLLCECRLQSGDSPDPFPIAIEKGTELHTTFKASTVLRFFPDGSQACAHVFVSEDMRGCCCARCRGEDADLSSLEALRCLPGRLERPLDLVQNLRRSFDVVGGQACEFLWVKRLDSNSYRHAPAHHVQARGFQSDKRESEVALEVAAELDPSYSQNGAITMKRSKSLTKTS